MSESISAAIGELSRTAEESGAARERVRCLERQAGLIAALRQASFCIRQLLPNDPDGQFTLSIINAALAKHDPAKAQS